MPSRLARALDVLRPNRILSPTAARILIVSQAAVALLLWSLSPWEVLPRPLETLTALRGLWMEQGLGRELFSSLAMNVKALAITAVISLGLSYLTVIPFFRPIAAALSKGRFLGMIGLTFIFTLIFGGGAPLKVSLLVFGMTVFFVTSMASVVAEIPRESFDQARTLHMNEWQASFEVVVLGTADQAIEVFRQNAAIGWMMLTMVEGISRSEGGLGAMLLNQNKHFHLAEVFAIQIVILAVGLTQDACIGLFKRIVCPYAHITLQRAS
jgi:NitT/TauT family transport system permease protein